MVKLMKRILNHPDSLVVRLDTVTKKKEENKIVYVTETASSNICVFLDISQALFHLEPCNYI